jgi:hypothetical protein
VLPLTRAALVLVCVVACGGSPSSSATSESASSPPVETSETEVADVTAPIDRVCAAELCGGPGAVVRTWTDASGAVARYEIIDSPRCSHIAGMFFDARGESDVVLPMPFYPPGTADEQASVTRMHDSQLTGLTAASQTTCP